MTKYDSYVLCLCDEFGNFRDECIYHNAADAEKDIAERGLSVVTYRSMTGFVGSTALILYAVDVPTIER